MWRTAVLSAIVSMMIIERHSQGFWGTREKGIYFRRTKANFWEDQGFKNNIGAGNTRTQFQFLGNSASSQFISGEQGNKYPHSGRASIGSVSSIRCVLLVSDQ